VKRLFAAVAMIIVFLMPATMAHASTPQDPQFPPPDSTSWGTSVMPYGGETYPQALARSEQQLAPQLIRFYNHGGDGPSWPQSTGTRPLVISFKLPPRQVLNGSHDAQLKTFFAATPRPTYWSYWHEPEDNVAHGDFTAADYRAAWRHIAAIAKSSGKPLRATLILMGWTAKPASGRTWTDFYPGADVIDVLAWDCYAWGPNDTPASVYGAAQSVSQQAGKPWAISETGAGSKQFTNPVNRQSMLTAMARYLATAEPRPEFVTYFDSDPDAPRIEHGWNISSTPGAAAAWRAGQTG